jgi:hypothetical protein
MIPASAETKPALLPHSFSPRHISPLFLLCAFALIALAACATPPPIPTPMAPTPTLVPLTQTLIPSPQQPTVTPTLTRAPLTAPTIIAAMRTHEWNYAVLGDSSSWGFMRVYPKYIEEDLGVRVKLFVWAFGNLSSANVLEQLRSNQQERLEVSQSQVITFYGNPLHLIGMRITNGNAGDKYDCSAQAVAQYKTEMGAIADEILLLRKGQPTIIRTYTRFMPFYRIWHATGQFEEYRRCVAALDAAILQVGKERGILVADTGLALNGLNRDQDPNDKSYLSDGVHENEVGAKIVADVFRKLGYAYIVP